MGQLGLGRRLGVTKYRTTRTMYTARTALKYSYNIQTMVLGF